MNFGYFLNIDFEILKELNVLCKRKKEVKLLHKSQTGAIKEIAIKLKEIKYIASKLYITGTSPNYPDGIFLRIDNIIKILKILPQKDLVKKPKAKIIVYKINPSIIDSISLLGEERILKQNKNLGILFVHMHQKCCQLPICIKDTKMSMVLSACLGSGTGMSSELVNNTSASLSTLCQTPRMEMGAVFIVGTFSLSSGSRKVSLISISLV